MFRLLALLALVLPSSLAAQDRVTSTFVVTRAGREVGKARITLQRAEGGPVARIQLSEQTLAGRSVEAVVNRSSDGAFDALQIEFRDSLGTEILRAGHSGNRFIVTSSGPTGRRTRELPAGDQMVLLDEELHGLLYVAAGLATEGGRPLTGLYLRSGRRVTFTATRRGMGSRGTAVDFTGGITAYLLLAADGRLERLELPTAGIVLTPLPR